jgi:hypothetical protein
MKHLTILTVAALGVISATVPALATTVILVPEPTSLSLVAAAAAGVVVAWRAARRK